MNINVQCTSSLNYDCCARNIKLPSNNWMKMHKLPMVRWRAFARLKRRLYDTNTLFPLTFE